MKMFRVRAVAGPTMCIYIYMYIYTTNNNNNKKRTEEIEREEREKINKWFKRNLKLPNDGGSFNAKSSFSVLL